MKIKFIDNAASICIEPLYLINQDSKNESTLWIKTDIRIHVDSASIVETIELSKSDYQSLYQILYNRNNVNHSFVWETLEETIRLEMIKEEEKYACCLNYITNMERNNYMHISFFLYENDIDNTISELASIIDWIGLCEKS